MYYIWFAVVLLLTAPTRRGGWSPLPDRTCKRRRKRYTSIGVGVAGIDILPKPVLQFGDDHSVTCDRLLPNME